MIELPDAASLMCKAIRELTEGTTLEDDDKIITDTAAKMRAFTSYKQYWTQRQLVDAIVTKWMERAQAKEFSHISPQQRFIRRARIVQADLVRQETRIKHRYERMTKRIRNNKLLLEANTTAMETKRRFEQLERRMDHSEPRNVTVRKLKAEKKHDDLTVSAEIGREVEKARAQDAIKQEEDYRDIFAQMKGEKEIACEIECNFKLIDEETNKAHDTVTGMRFIRNPELEKELTDPDAFLKGISNNDDSKKS